VLLAGIVLRPSRSPHWEEACALPCVRLTCSASYVCLPQGGTDDAISMGETTSNSGDSPRPRVHVQRYILYALVPLAFVLGLLVGSGERGLPTTIYTRGLTQNGLALDTAKVASSLIKYSGQVGSHLSAQGCGKTFGWFMCVGRFS
jgi:hypothetical protein